MFSFLNRKKKDELDYGNPMANAYNQKYGSQAVLDKHNQSVNQSKQPQQSTQQPYPIQQMADGRTKYSDGSIRGQKTVTPTTYQQPKPQPRPQPKPQPTQPTQPSLTNQYIQNRAGNAQQRVQGIKDRSQEQMDLQKQLTESRQNTLSKIGDISGESFNTYANQLRQGLGIQKGTADRQVGTAKADYYDQQRQREQARQERMKGLEGTLASLGTLQSSAMGNLGAKINQGAGRQDAQAQRQLNTRVADIQDQVRLAENEVETLIKQEAANYRQQIAKLSGLMDENSIEYKQAVSSLADQADQRINNILDQLDQFSYNAKMQMLEAQQGQQDQLSDQFLSTGQPMTRADMIWIAENPDKVEGLQQNINQAAGGLSESAQKAAGVIEQIMRAPERGIKGITGRVRFGTSDPARSVEGLVNQLSAELQLEEARRMKGQGQMSDAERAILADSVAALNLDKNGKPKVSADRFYQIMGELYRQLTGQDLSEVMSGGGTEDLDSLASSYGL